MSLSYYYALLRQKEMELQRLQNCSNQLNAHQQEFIHYERNVKEPELTPTTWHGKLATTFEQLRNDGMLTSYRDISYNQFADVFTRIAEKIQQLQNEIVSIKQTIAALEAAERAREAAARAKASKA
ncbi:MULTISPECIES: YwqH-like family protein [Bacillus]|uniref:YwqH-like family protein n=1 Tax=Bacillus TaxID=1386 RepID=UPI00031FDB6E|nr:MULTISPECIES: DUF5082 family protein [Bacillus]